MSIYRQSIVYSLVSTLLFLLLCVGYPTRSTAQSMRRMSHVRILYFNDAHDLYPVDTPAGRLGGVARMQTVVDSIRAEHPDVLLLFGGDLAGGTLSGKLYKGEEMVRALNRLGVSYANFGQHEFDYGVAQAERLVSESRFGWFSSNVVLGTGAPIAGALPYVVHEVRGKRVGLIGLTDKVDTSRPGSGVVGRDIVASAREAIAHMGEVDLLVAVTQMSMAKNEALLKACPEIGLIFTEETSQYASNISYLGRVPVIASCGNMGHLEEIVWREGMWYRSHVIDDSVRPDAEVDAYVTAKEAESDRELSRVVGQVPGVSIRPTKAQLARLIAESFAAATGAELALMHGSGIRASVDSPELTLRAVYSMLPYDNKVYTVRMTGAEFEALYRKAVAADAHTAVAGASPVVEQDGVGMSRQLLYRGGKPLDPRKYYTVALPEYIAMGGAPFERMAIERQVHPMPYKGTDAEALIRFLKPRR